MSQFLISKTWKVKFIILRILIVRIYIVSFINVIILILSILVLPDVKEFEITEDWEFLILACDGIWDVMTNQDVVQFVRSRLACPKMEGDEQQFVDPEEICEELLKHCLAPDVLMDIGCDNMTVVLVCFLHGKSYSHLVSKCQQVPADSDLPDSIGDAAKSSMGIIESCI